MERQNDMFFTIWYGVYRSSTRTLRWAGGGHPAALMVPPEPGAASTLLESDGPLIGAVEGLDFTHGETAVPEGSRVYLYSDGAFEICRPDGSMWAFADFLATLTTPSQEGESRIDGLLARIRDLSGREEFVDDFSMLELRFD
jgi:sigma-B regulation protein RsbU (phosphoserine phosphatase)